MIEPGKREPANAIKALRQHVHECSRCEAGPALCETGWILLRHAEAISKRKPGSCYPALQFAPA